jgi:hypothetical protein
MPVESFINEERRLVVTTAWDHVTFEEFAAHQDRLLSDPDFNPDFDQLLDGTKVTGLDVSIEEIKALARRGVFSPTSRRAFVTSNPTFFGMGRVAQSYFALAPSPSQVSVFYDLPSALDWLGLNESDIEPNR